MPTPINLRKTERLLAQYLESDKSRLVRRKILLDHMKAYYKLVYWLHETARFRIEKCPDPTCDMCQDTKKHLNLARIIIQQEHKL